MPACHTMKLTTKNKRKIRVILLLTVVITASLFAFRKPDRRPNIIFLLADDLRYDVFGYMGNAIIKTPNIDGLAREGTMFHNAYVTTAICAISRASIFSGQYACRHGILDFVTPFSDSARKNTYPELMRRNGYFTGFIGKYGVGAKLPATEFDYWKGFGGMGTYHHKDAAGNYKHLTNLIGDQAEEFLRMKKNKPFCLSISFKAPHVEGTNVFAPDPVYNSWYEDDSIPLPVTGDDRFFNLFPETFSVGNEGRERWQVRFSTPQLYQENVKKYYRLVTGIDEVVRRIRAQLEKSGQDKNTIIMFTSDNGFYLGEHGLAGKWYGHEESIRVPLILYDPTLVAKGARIRKEMVLNVDMAPTMLDYAGIPIPSGMQGHSLRPLAEGKKMEWRKEFFYDHLFASPKVYIPKSEGLVGEEYKYIRYFKHDDSADFFYEELFNTIIDPYETDNLANRPDKAAIKNDMIKKMKEYSTELRQPIAKK